MEFLRLHQQNIMLFLSGICFILAILSFLTNTLNKRRRWALVILEFVASLLLIMDRFAYQYRGNVSTLGYWMVRISNFAVFFLSIAVIFHFNSYLIDLMLNEGQLKKVPRRLRAVQILCVAGVLMLIISQFTGLYYTFDEYNRYQRSPYYLLSYLFTLGCLLLQLDVIFEYSHKINKEISILLVTFTLFPLLAAILQLFCYGLSLINITLVGETILLFMFVLTDMNKTVDKANNLKIEFLQEEQKTTQIMFEQTATALANAIDAKDEYTHGHSMRVAEYSHKIAVLADKDEKFCRDIYFAGLLHDVGKIGIPNNIINKNGKLTDEEFAEIKKHPVIGKQILSSISKSPYLSIGANSHHERFDGRGYPEGLKGEDIPEIARIIAVADAYDAMTSKRSYRDPIPQDKVREEIVKGMGTQFDPAFAKLMLHLIDLDTEYDMKEHEEVKELGGKDVLHCADFRSEKSEGIILTRSPLLIKVHSRSEYEDAAENTIPSLIVFDSLDARVHETESKRKEMLYNEYAIIRFDGTITEGSARKIKKEIIPTEAYKDKSPSSREIFAEYKNGLNYEVNAVKYKDHILIVITNKFQTVKITIALKDSTRYAYLSLTGQNCLISNVEIIKSDVEITKDYIPRIAEEISYIDGPEGDLPNIQIDGWRSAATQGIPVKDNMTITFHSKSLPTARLIWHCPFICLFYSKDKKVNGDGYREFVVVRLDGENWEENQQAKNTILINKNDDFNGWEAWKALNKAGMDCKIELHRDGNKITVFTENSGIAIKSITTIKADAPEIYVSLTGDQVAITNIHIS